MSINSPKGVYDILPIGLDEKEIWRRSDLWQFVEKTAAQLAEHYGFKEIRTPIFERTELFQRGVGEGSDIVLKEMYTFLDKAGRSMTLRPELTASVMRAFIEKQLQQYSSVHKFFYLGPMFRYDRPQAGRYRQFFHFGIEAIGNGSAQQDVEVIDFLYSFYQQLGLKDLTLHLNSVGDPDSRLSYREALVDFLNPLQDQLSADSKIRLKINPLRILDSKEACDQALLENAPSIHHFYSEECKRHLHQVCELLDKIGIGFNINPKLVRGLDYYNKTVFEVTSRELGAQNTIGAGGRYDGLLKTLGGPDLPSVGWATGIERVLQTMLAQEVFFPSPPAPQIFLVGLGETAKQRAFTLLKELRGRKIRAEMDFSEKKLKDILRYADQIKAQFTIVIGDAELESGTVELKEMSNRTVHKASLRNFAEELANRLKER